jgi:hypothetical protein
MTGQTRTKPSESTHSKDAKIERFTTERQRNTPIEQTALFSEGFDQRRVPNLVQFSLGA